MQRVLMEKTTFSVNIRHFLAFFRGPGGHKNCHITKVSMQSLIKLLISINLHSKII
jgi:hypothetical protein